MAPDADAEYDARRAMSLPVIDTRRLLLLRRRCRYLPRYMLR